MVAGREWKVIGSDSGARRGVDYINATETITYDGVRNRGFEDFLRRTALDYLTIGRTITYANPKISPILYLDPTVSVYHATNNHWYDSDTQTFYPSDDIYVYHPKPKGKRGLYGSILEAVIPMASLWWLLKEHDSASLDGRKVKEIMIVGSDKMKDSMVKAMTDLITQYQSKGFDSSKHSLPIVSTENSLYANVADQVSMLGISNIPPAFDREQFMFEYVNQIAASLGLSLRHFWNSERATNRALEEVQEARQQQKGPSLFVRHMQRFMNTGFLRHFGPSTRFAFIEEVDIQSQLTTAQVLKLYVDSAAALQQIAPDRVNVDNLFSWLQGNNIISPNLDLLYDQAHGEVQQMELQDPAHNENISDGEGNLTPDAKKSFEPSVGEVVVDSSGSLLERRISKYISIPEVSYSIGNINISESAMIYKKSLHDALIDYYVKNNISDEQINSIAVKSFDSLTDSDHIALKTYMEGKI